MVEVGALCYGHSEGDGHLVVLVFAGVDCGAGYAFLAGGDDVTDSYAGALCNLDLCVDGFYGCVELVGLDDSKLVAALADGGRGRDVECRVSDYSASGFLCKDLLDVDRLDGLCLGVGEVDFHLLRG